MAPYANDSPNFSGVYKDRYVNTGKGITGHDISYCSAYDEIPVNALKTSEILRSREESLVKKITFFHKEETERSSKQESSQKRTERPATIDSKTTEVQQTKEKIHEGIKKI